MAEINSNSTEDATTEKELHNNQSEEDTTLTSNNQSVSSVESNQNVSAGEAATPANEPTKTEAVTTKLPDESNKPADVIAKSSDDNVKPTNVVEKKTKIDVLLKAAGDAPIMKKKKWAVDGNKPMAYLTEFIRKYIKCEPSESLFLYVNQTFAPSPDQILSNLFECFGTDGKLVLHYCKSQAWG